MAKKIRLIDIVTYTFLLLLVIVTVFPIIYTILSSFKSNMEIFTNPDKLFPEQFTLDNYKQAWGTGRFNIPKMFWNSTYYTICNVLINIAISTMGGYVFERGVFPGKKIWFTIFSSLMFISLGSITIYPTFEVLDKIGLAKSIWGLIFMRVFGIPIVYIMLIRSFIKTLPRELDEAAEIDGCSFFGVFRHIILPLLKPVIATITILSFQGSWNEYLMPTLFTITKPEQQTLIVGIMKLKRSGEAASSWNLMLAGATVAVIPVLIIYAICNKYFVDGITAGAVKG